MPILRLVACLMAAGALAACASTPPPDTAIMPLTSVGTPIMSDQGAIGLAGYVLGSSSRGIGHPVDAARALAGIEYLAGALYSNPHWMGIPAEDKQRMLQARIEVRNALGIPPGAASQAVVDGLIAAAAGLDAGNEAGARAALPEAVFTLGPDRTLALLRHLPPLPIADAAAGYVNADTMTNCGFTANCG